MDRHHNGPAAAAAAGTRLAHERRRRGQRTDPAGVAAVSAFIVFAATFVTVFALGLQSRIVNRGQYLAAAFVSAAIATGSLELYAVLAHPTGWDRFGYYLGGIVGITSSIYFHKRAEAWILLQIARWKARRAVSRRPDEHGDVALAGGMPAVKCPRCGCGPEVAPCKYDALCPRLQTDVH